MLRVADGGNCSVTQSFLCWRAGLNEGDDDLTGAASLLSSCPLHRSPCPVTLKNQKYNSSYLPNWVGGSREGWEYRFQWPSGAGPSRAGGGREQSPGAAAAPRLARCRPQPPCCFPSSPLRHRRCGARPAPA